MCAKDVRHADDVLHETIESVADESQPNISPLSLEDLFIEEQIEEGLNFASATEVPMADSDTKSV